MQNRDPYKLLYNNLWLYKLDKTTESMAVPVDKSEETTAKSATPQPITNITVTTPHEQPQPQKIDTSIDNWDTLVDNITNCTKCGLCSARKNVVIERGSRTAKWMFVGEGPGEQEDIQGKPFVGASGQLLQKMITAMQLDPATDVYICNVVKCRPPSNRNPEPKEIEQCKDYLFSQIELVKPQIIITLGRFAHQTLLNTTMAVGRLRLKQHFYKNIPLIVTYHPAYLLRNPSAKKDAWADLQLAMQIFKELV
ncbi:MAG TPA: uracil-DNA glycosylase [Aquella sp.]|nr:uracil-DNA glycosylase [Aquella sp.]